MSMLRKELNKITNKFGLHRACVPYLIILKVNTKCKKYLNYCFIRHRYIVILCVWLVTSVESVDRINSKLTLSPEAEVSQCFITQFSFTVKRILSKQQKMMLDFSG